MVISFSVNLLEVLMIIKCNRGRRSLFLDKDAQRRIELYGNAKWAIVDLLNEKYSFRFAAPIDLYHWLYFQEHDEVAYFLNEAGSNVLNYGENKLPSAFHLWLGEKGFIIGIEQEGKGFNAIQIDELHLKENEGAGFEFFRNCHATIFFDNPQNANVIYFMQTWR